LKSRVFRQDYCEYWLPNNGNCRDTGDGQILNQLSGVDLRGTFTQNVKNNDFNVKLKTHKNRAVLGLKHRGDDDALR